MKSPLYWFFLVLALFNLASCSDDDKKGAGLTVKTMDIPFLAKVGNADANCGQTYHNIGVTNADFKLMDFRMYISNLALKMDDGTEVMADLEQDGVWQYDSVAMLDFENGCDNGSAETNNIIHAKATFAAAKVPQGICFDLGIPFDLNHADLASLPSPLNVSGMYWVWQYGHKFLGIDGVVNGTANFYVHVGSTGCTNAGNDANAVPDSACTYPNRPRICLDTFNIDTNAVKVDLKKILVGADVTVNDGMAMGMSCMSFNSDVNCAQVLPNLGIDFVYDDGVSLPVEYPATTTQKVFSAVPK